MESDRELMRAVRQNDTDAFATLVDRYRPRAEGLARSLLGDGALAQDAVQDCFVKVYLLRDRYRDEFSFEAWLFALVRNRCIDLLRKRGRRPWLPLETAEAQAAEDTPEADFLRREDKLRLWHALEGLRPEERQLLLGYAREQKPYRELAAEQGMTVAQVKIKLHRIRKKLKAVKEESNESLS